MAGGGYDQTGISSLNSVLKNIFQGYLERFYKVEKIKEMEK